MEYLRRFLVIPLFVVFVSCSMTDYKSTWHDPAALSKPMRNQTVSAFLLSGNTAARRGFEDNLATELTKNGIETLPGYEVLPNVDVTDKNAVLQQLKKTQVDESVFMRIVDRHQEVSFLPSSVWYPGPYYDPFFWRDGAFYGPGFVGNWPYYDPGYYQLDTIVSVETLIYSVPDGKLLFAGLSETINPDKVHSFVKELVKETVKELTKAGMIQKTRTT